MISFPTYVQFVLKTTKIFNSIEWWFPPYILADTNPILVFFFFLFIKKKIKKKAQIKKLNKWLDTFTDVILIKKKPLPHWIL